MHPAKHYDNNKDEQYDKQANFEISWTKLVTKTNRELTVMLAKTTPQNNRVNGQKQSLFTCVLNFGTFLCRPLQNNNEK